MDPIKIVVVVIASLPHSPRKIVKTSSLEKASLGLIVSNIVETSTQLILASVQLNTTLTKVSSTSSTEQTTLPSTLVLVNSTISAISTLTISTISTFLASPTLFTIISILSMKITSARIVETKPQLSTKILSKGK